MSPAVPFDVGHPHGQFVPSDGGTGFGCVRESRAAVRLPIAKADPVAGCAPMLEIVAPVVLTGALVMLMLASVVVVVIGVGVGALVVTVPVESVVVMGVVGTVRFVVGFVGVVIGVVTGIFVESVVGFVVGLLVGSVVGILIGLGVGIAVESRFVESVGGVGGLVVGVCAIIRAGRIDRPATPRILSLIGSP